MKPIIYLFFIFILISFTYADFNPDGSCQPLTNCNFNYNVLNASEEYQNNANCSYLLYYTNLTLHSTGNLSNFTDSLSKHWYNLSINLPENYYNILIECSLSNGETAKLQDLLKIKTYIPAQINTTVNNIQTITQIINTTTIIINNTQTESKSILDNMTDFCRNYPNTLICQQVQTINTTVAQINQSVNNIKSNLTDIQSTLAYFNNTVYVNMDSNFTAIASNFNMLQSNFNTVYNYFNCQYSNNEICKELQQINSSLYNVYASDTSTVLVGDYYMATFYVIKKNERQYIEPPKITLQLANGSTIWNGTMELNDSYFYTYQLNTSLITDSGGRNIRTIINYTVAGTNQRTDTYWYLQNNMADVSVSSYVASDTILCNIGLTNMGGFSQEYKVQSFIARSSYPTAQFSEALKQSTYSILLGKGRVDLRTITFSTDGLTAGINYYCNVVVCYTSDCTNPSYASSLFTLTQSGTGGYNGILEANINRDATELQPEKKPLYDKLGVTKTAFFVALIIIIEVAIMLILFFVFRRKKKKAQKNINIG